MMMNANIEKNKNVLTVSLPDDVDLSELSMIEVVSKDTSAVFKLNASNYALKDLLDKITPDNLHHEIF
ncbi:hypothetical protein [Prolixibacter sp. NT017]|uniref:hypothetical protein n=1 Tax=Prolixibacter sp. NT017 TaxID=2652390 RepID=UPI0012864155|nr:hypothetical protein [Prolixibacter sp. NT017]GET25841.1 hypothetical protein NT017_21700 [Prolixibacter sp. NT017]